MKYTRLGRTNLTVSEIGFGAWAIGGNKYGNSYGPTDDCASLDSIRVALDLGCTFFDTADVYGHGHSEELLGRALREAKKLNDVVVATKVGGNFTKSPTVLDFSRNYITRAIDASLSRLRREYIDLYQLHNPPLGVVEDESVFDVLEALKASGKIRHYGVSIHEMAEGLALIATGRVDTLQLVYNLFSLVDRARFQDQLFARAKANVIGLIAREPLANGFLTGRHRLDTKYGDGDVRADLPVAERRLRISLADTIKSLARQGVSPAQLALRFVLDEPAIVTTVVGIKTEAQAIENLAAASLPPFETICEFPKQNESVD